MTVFTAADGQQWQIDYQGCVNTLRAFAQSKARLEALNPRSSSHNFIELVHDDQRFRTVREQTYSAAVQGFDNALAENPETAIRMLVQRLRERQANMTRLRERYTGATSANMRNMNGRIVAGQLGLAATQIFISVSQAAILSLCTGGIGAAAQAGNVVQATNAAYTAAAAAAGFAAISGMTSYQTSGDAGAAIATAGTQFTANLIGVGSGSQTVFMLTLTSATMNVANSTIIDYHTVGSQGSFQITESLARAAAGEALGNVAPNDFVSAFGVSVIDILSDSDNGLGSMLAQSLLPVTAAPGSASAGPRSHMPLSQMASIGSQLPSGEAELALSEIFARDQQARNSEAAWTSTPFYRAMAGLSDADLMSQPEREVRGMLLRPA